MSLIHSESEEALAPADLRIALIGRSGAGKSSIGNTILAREALKELRSRASEIQSGRVEERNISLINTPGFFNTHLSDEDMQAEMMKALHLAHPGPHVFLLIIRLDGFTEDVWKTVKTIHRFFGREAFRFTMVLFCGRKVMSKREWIEFRLEKKTRELLSFCEEKCHLLIHKNMRDENQIESLLENIDEVVRKNGRGYFTTEVLTEDARRKDRGWERTKSHEERDQRRTNEKQTQHMIEEDRDEAHGGGLVHEEKQVTSLLAEPDLLIVLLGKSGSGKSSTANRILRRTVESPRFDESFLSVPQTCEKHSGDVCGRNISIIETPGWSHMRINEKRMKEEIEKFTSGSRVFLLVIKLGEMITEEEKQMMKWIEEHFGEEAALNTIVLFTHADRIEDGEYIRERSDLSALVDQFGGRFISFNNKDTTNQSQIIELMESIEKMLGEREVKHHTVDTLSFEEKEDTEKEDAVLERKSNWIKGVFILFFGALAAAALAQRGLEG